MQFITEYRDREQLRGGYSKISVIHSNKAQLICTEIRERWVGIKGGEGKKERKAGRVSVINA